MDDNSRRANDETRAAWNENASFWDTRMGEGNDFQNVLLWPATERLLALQPGERVLDVACGNGLTSRRLARMGAEVVALDFAADMIAHAQQRTSPTDGNIRYHVLDATDEAALLQLGAQRFDAALCNMALFDMAEIMPLLRALGCLLRPGGRFVFSVLHPCFNSARTVHVAQMEEREGQTLLTYGIQVWGYKSARMEHAIAMRGQPALQWIFHRPLEVLLGACFAAGFVLDGLEEPAFPPDHPVGSHSLGWGGQLAEIPPVLVARMRLRT